MSDITVIDYSPLAADRNAFQKVYMQHVVLNTTIFAGAIILCLVAWAVTATFVLGWIGFAAVVLRVMVLGSQVKAYKNGVWEKFAGANGWSVDLEFDVTASIPLSLQFGHSQTYSTVITAVLGSIAADMFVYQTTTGSGKSQQTYAFSIAQVRLPAVLPHILLLAKGNIWGALRSEFVSHETLALEGDFGDYFTLQIEKGQEVNALEILTPDVMQALVGFSQKEDIEIVSDSLYFILSGDARTPEATQKLIQSVASLSSQVMEQVAHRNVPEPPPATQQTDVPQPAADS